MFILKGVTGSAGVACGIDTNGSPLRSVRSRSSRFLAAGEDYDAERRPGTSQNRTRTVLTEHPVRPGSEGMAAQSSR